VAEHQQLDVLHVQAAAATNKGTEQSAHGDVEEREGHAVDPPRPRQTGTDTNIGALHEPVDLAGDPLIAPARVLSSEAKDEFADLAADRRTSGLTGVRPASSNETAVPARQRRRRHQKRLPRRAWRQPTRSTRKTRSLDRSCGRRARRSRTDSSCRSTTISLKPSDLDAGAPCKHSATRGGRATRAKTGTSRATGRAPDSRDQSWLDRSRTKSDAPTTGSLRSRSSIAPESPPIHIRKRRSVVQHRRSHVRSVELLALL
jgi:hypothetical protein